MCRVLKLGGFGNFAFKHHIHGRLEVGLKACHVVDRGPNPYMGIIAQLGQHDALKDFCTYCQGYSFGKECSEAKFIAFGAGCKANRCK